MWGKVTGGGRGKGISHSLSVTVTEPLTYHPQQNGAQLPLHKGVLLPVALCACAGSVSILSQQESARGLSSSLLLLPVDLEISLRVS